MILNRPLVHRSRGALAFAAMLAALFAALMQSAATHAAIPAEQTATH